MTDEQTPQTMDEILNPGLTAQRDPNFPDAPVGWSRQQAEALAGQANTTLTDDHWEVVRALQHYYRRHQDQPLNRRELHDALDEHFHAKGGLKFLYELFPEGPLARGCPLAGLEPPSGATDKGMGSTT